MANSTRADDQVDVAWKEDVIEIDVLEESDIPSAALAPAIDAFSRDIDKSAKFSGLQLEPSDLPKSEVDYAAAEYERLIRREEEFKASAVYYNRVASLAKRAGRLADAASHAAQAAKLSEATYFQYRHAVALFDAQEKGDANRLLWSLAEEEKDIQSALRLAELKIADNDIDGAIKCVMLALEEDELDWRTNMVAGAVALIESSFEAAIRHFRIALQERPRSAIIYFNLSLAHYWLGNEFAALKNARKAVALNPFGQKGQLYFADLAIKFGRVNDKELARRFIELYLQEDCDDFIVSRLTHIARELGEQKSVIRVIDQLPKQCKSPAVNNNLGVLYADQKERRKARILFRRAALSPDEKGTIQDRMLAAANLANSMLELGDYEGAEKITEILLGDTDAQDAVGEENLSRVLGAKLKALFFQEKIKAGNALLEEIIGAEVHQPRLDFVASTLKLCYETVVNGNFDEALQYARIALDAAQNLRINRESSLNLALNNYVYILIELNRLEEASQYIGSLRTDLDDAEFATATIGLYNIRMGNIEKGESLYRKAASLARSKSVKQAMLKKLNYELALAVEDSSPRDALKYAKSASKIRNARNRWESKDLGSKVAGLLSRLEQS